MRHPPSIGHASAHNTTRREEGFAPKSSPTGGATHEVITMAVVFARWRVTEMAVTPGRVLTAFQKPSGHLHMQNTTRLSNQWLGRDWDRAVSIIRRLEEHDRALTPWGISARALTGSSGAGCAATGGHI